MIHVLKLFLETGAHLKGHFQLTGGMHSPEYLQCALVLQHPRHAETLGASLAKAIKALGGTHHIQTVVSPAMGGLIIGHEVARSLGARHIFTERDSDKKMTLRRGFAVRPGETVVVVEDVITTGGSSAEVVELLRAAGANVVAAGSIIDRSGGRAELGVPRTALANVGVVSWAADACPLCADGIPVVKPGSRPA